MTLISLRDLENKSGTVYNAGSLDTLYAEDLLPLKHVLQTAGSEFYMLGGSIISDLTVVGSMYGYIVNLERVIPQGIIPLGSLTLVIPQGILPVGSIPNLVAYIPQGQLITGSLPNNILISGSITTTGSIIAGSFFGYGATLTNILPQGVIPSGSLINALPQGIIPVGSLTFVLPQGILPVGSIPTLTAYIPQGQLISGSLPNNAGFIGSVTLTGSRTVTYGTEYDNGNAGTTPTINWSNGQKQKITINGSPTTTFSFTNPSGAGNFVLRCIQDMTGSIRSYVYPSNCLWAGSIRPTLTIGAGSIDILSFYYDGNGSYYGNSIMNFI